MTEAARGWRRLRRWVGLVVLAVIVLHVGWCAAGRATADERRLVVGHAELPGLAADTGAVGHDVVRIRVLAWNIAHGRGDVATWPKNWRGGDEATRRARLDSIARVLARADADVVILDEADFHAGWSDGVNHAAYLARAAGYPVRVEQRNYDVRFPFVRYVFGNAVLSRLPLEEARWVPLPPHTWIEPLLVGAKAASVVTLETAGGPVAVVPIHLEVRSEATRLEAVPVLQGIRVVEDAPVVLGGDFNTAPPGWPGTTEHTAVGALMDRGLTSLRAREEPSLEEYTFPSYDLDRAIDWVLVEPPLRVVEARVLHDAATLSDHLPVLVVVARD